MSTASNAIRAGVSLAAIFGALALAAPGLVEDEGWVRASYNDPAHGAALPTACAGVTGAKYGVQVGKRYSEAECEAMTAQAMLDHALAIQHCTPTGLRTTTTTVIREKAQEAERVVQSAPGASAPLDPDNRSTVCAELERMRGSAVCTD